MQARTRPVFGSPYQASPKRVTLDVTQQHAEMVVLLNRKGFEPALPDVPAGVVMPLVAADMRGQQPVHPPAEVAVACGPE